MPIDRNSAQYITGAIYKPTQTSAPGVWDLDDQANNIAKNLWPLPPQAVQRSLRFNSADSAYFNRTPASAGNQRTWTWSGWVKRSKLSSGNAMFSTVNGSAFNYFSFGTGGGGDQIQFAYYNGSTDVFNVNTGSISFRDTNSWYHIVLAVDTTLGVSANTVKIYVNGIQQTLGGIFPSQNYDTPINSAISHIIGGGTGGYTNYLFNGYIAEVNFINSQQLDATSFGETDPQTGVWIPKRYTGTYGTNGFRLSFANNSSITALGYDSSGQGNNWTPNNFSITPGVGNDVFVDVPSLYGTDTRLGGEVLGNYCTLNPLSIRRNFTLSNGNLDGINNGSNDGGSTGTLAVPTTGKWYWEMILTGINGGIYLCYTGLVSQPNFPGGSFVNVPGCLLYPRSGNVCFYDNAGNAVCITETAYNGDVYGLAYDADTGLVDFYKNGLKYSGYSVTVTTGINYWPAFFIGNQGPTASINFGQRPFAYPAPTGYKALCTTNLPAPAIGQTSNNQADNHFNVVTYIGNGTAQTITGVGFQPDLVWIKNRDAAGENHRLIDSVRGVTKVLYSSITNAEDPNNTNTVTSFTSDGFSVGNQSAVNGNTNRIVAWCWNAGGNTVTNSAGTNSATIASTYRANPRAGFSIVTYTGNGTSGATVAHGLGSAPQMMLVRDRNNVNDWVVYHTAIGNGTVLVLNNQNGAVVASAGYWNNTTPNSNTFTVGTTSNVNTASRDYLAYCWSAIPGYSAFGSYVGIAGGTNGSFIYTGFRPRFLLIKGNFTTEWLMIDTARNSSNPCNLRIDANSSGTEQTIIYVDILSNGFKLVNSLSYMDNSGSTIIYAAFAETPARLSTAR